MPPTGWGLRIQDAKKCIFFFHLHILVYTYITVTSTYLYTLLVVDWSAVHTCTVYIVVEVYTYEYIIYTLLGYIYESYIYAGTGVQCQRKNERDGFVPV